MKQFNVEGFYISAKSAHKTGIKSEKVEFFHRAVWANDSKEALKEATYLLNGGRWKEIPKISDMTEEKRMRKLRAPELPGLEEKPEKKK